MLFSEESYRRSISDHPQIDYFVYPKNLGVVIRFMTVPVELCTDSAGNPKLFVAKAVRFDDLVSVEKFISMKAGGSDFAYFMTIRDNSGYVLRASFEEGANET